MDNKEIQLTEIEQLLVDFLMMSRAERGTRVLAFILLETDKQKLKMCQFLRENEDATEDEILAKAREIAAE